MLLNLLHTGIGPVAAHLAPELRRASLSCSIICMVIAETWLDVKYIEYWSNPKKSVDVISSIQLAIL